MGSDPMIVKDQFHYQYQVITNSREKPHPSAKLRELNNPQSAERFLNSLLISEQSWNALGVREILKRCQSGRVRFYELPRVDDKNLISHNGKGTGYIFLRGQQPLPHANYPIATFPDHSCALDLIENLEIPKGYWCNVLRNARMADYSLDGQEQYTNRINECLLDGRLSAYIIANYNPPRAKPSKFEYIETGHTEASHTLGPEEQKEPDNWIDLEYLYADGTGVSGAQYIVKDIDVKDGEENSDNPIEVAKGTLPSSGKVRVTLPNHVKNVSVEFFDDPATINVLKPAKPKKQAAPSGWLERMGNAMQNAWEAGADAMDWAWETVQGDFNENPTSGQIITNALITMIPVIDQAADVRDILANLKLLIWEKRYDEFGVWLALFFTLIGLIPTLGSALKGVLKLVWKGAKLEELLKVFNWFMKGNGVKWLKDLKGGKLQQYAKEAAEIGHRIFDVVISKLNSIQRYIPKRFIHAKAQINELLKTLHTVKGQINKMFAEIGAQLSEKLGKILDVAKRQIGKAKAKSKYSRQQVKAEPISPEQQQFIDEYKAKNPDTKLSDEDLLDQHEAGDGANNVPDKKAAAPPVKYGTNEATWTLDESGRPISVEAKLDSTYSTERSRSEIDLQGKVGGEARLDDDDGGHLIGHRFMSDQGEKNLFPQNANLNRSAYKKMENEWADWTDEGFEVKLKVSLDPPGADRPTSIISQYEVIDPKTGDVVFERDHEFSNSPGESFERISKSDIKEFRN